VIDIYENQLDAIRVGLYEQTKNLTNHEVARVTNEHARKIADKYGIRIVKGAMSFTEKNASNI
jgi:phenylalanyl-tRNA synthetase beta subunit